MEPGLALLPSPKAGLRGKSESTGQERLHMASLPSVAACLHVVSSQSVSQNNPSKGDKRQYGIMCSALSGYNRGLPSGMSSLSQTH